MSAPTTGFLLRQQPTLRSFMTQELLILLGVLFRNCQTIMRMSLLESLPMRIGVQKPNGAFGLLQKHISDGCTRKDIAI